MKNHVLLPCRLHLMVQSFMAHPALAGSSLYRHSFGVRPHVDQFPMVAVIVMTSSSLFAPSPDQGTRPCPRYDDWCDSLQTMACSAMSNQRRTGGNHFARPLLVRHVVLPASLTFRLCKVDCLKLSWHLWRRAQHLLKHSSSASPIGPSTRTPDRPEVNPVPEVYSILTPRPGFWEKVVMGEGRHPC